jgi:two-component system, NtrC family, sensor histidine kinase PilS
MAVPQPASSTLWLDSAQFPDTPTAALAEGVPTEFDRLWRGFMTARVTLGIALLALQSGLWAIGQMASASLIVVAGLYLLAALVVRLFATPHQFGHVLTIEWLLTVGVDAVAFSALQLLHAGAINYAPLLALTVLMASVLGPFQLAMGTAAGVGALLLGHAGWEVLTRQAASTPVFVQAGVIGVGCLAIAFLSNQLSARLAEEERRALANRRSAQAQRRVNQMVIESMQVGILVVDADGLVRTANPAARAMLGPDGPRQGTILSLREEPAWRPLAELVAVSFAHRDGTSQEVRLVLPGQGQSRMHVRTQLTGLSGVDAQNLCVVFLQDLREVEARMRADKLASMGRMSAAVAHEIRNPLAAIVQANALLEEDSTDPRQRGLIRMVGQNAQRLGRIVEDVLNLTRVQSQDTGVAAPTLALGPVVASFADEWVAQHRVGARLLVLTQVDGPLIEFENEHLRRVLVNLLDNARRYAGAGDGAIQVHAARDKAGRGTLEVWSDSPPLEPSVERHLFEPFFSSESRSSGLGLYICRELCEGHGAIIRYGRRVEPLGATESEGNSFSIVFRSGGRAAVNGS